MKNIKIFSGILLIIFLISSCHKKTATGGFDSRALKSEIDASVDSMNTAWKVMIDSDDEKMRNIADLHKSIANTPSYNKSELDSLKKLQVNLLSIRYKPETMTDSQIDEYDRVTDLLIKGTLNLMNHTPEIGNDTNAGTLARLIMEQDEMVVVYRLHYDNWAKKYNVLLNENSKKLSQLGKDYQDLKPRKLFTIGQ